MDKFDKKVTVVSLFLLVLLLVSINLGTAVEAAVLSLIGLTILTYVCWNLFNSGHNWFTFTMCFLLGVICLVGFYGCLSLSGHMIWFSWLAFVEIIVAFVGAIYRKAKA